MTAKVKVPKILIVDDRSENLLALNAILADLGVEMIEALSGAEALTEMMCHDFALVILDVQMPEMDGFEVAELMRKSSRTKETPIIFVTAISKEEQYVYKGYHSGAVDYIFKPFDPTVLLCKVRIFIELYSQKQLLAEKNRIVEEKLVMQEQMLVQQSKMATIGEMLGAIAHQWKQPLNRLGLMIQTMEYEMPDDCQKHWDLDHFVKTSMKEVHFMGDTITDFMRFIRPNEGKEVCVIREQIKDVVALVKSSIQKEYISLSFEINDSENEPLVATCHGNDLNHILINLIVNARDAILKKRENTSDAYKGQIIVSLTNKLDCVWISVSDDGGGIPFDIQDKIFEAHFTTKSEKTGSGIGLYVIKRIIEERAKGTIEVVNNQEGGATFTITLPK